MFHGSIVVLRCLGTTKVGVGSVAVAVVVVVQWHNQTRRNDVNGWCSRLQLDALLIKAGGSTFLSIDGGDLDSTSWASRRRANRCGFGFIENDGSRSRATFLRGERKLEDLVLIRVIVGIVLV